jgi:uncharacterized protein (TIGR02391 family)
MAPLFTQSQIEAVAGALGDTGDGLTGSEIGHLLNVCGISDPTPQATKRHRLHNAFAASQNARGNRGAILAFIRHSTKPERHLRNPERFEPLRANLNRALAFCGMAVDASGKLSSADAVSTIAEAERRAQDLRQDLVRRGVHDDVLRFCRSEFLADDYFHAVLETVKSIADKIRTRTGLTDDGAALVDRALCGEPPMLAINPLNTDSEKSEQKGFANLVRGCFGMFRNPTAHAPRIHWAMGKGDAEDLLSLASLVHRRLDAAHMPPRVGEI